MPKLTDMVNIWDTIKEIDLRPLAQQGGNMVRVAVIGPADSGRGLVELMRQDPGRPGIYLRTPIQLLSLDDAHKAASADLLVLILNAWDGLEAGDFSREKDLARSWAEARRKVVVIIDIGGHDRPVQPIHPWLSWGTRRVCYGSPLNQAFLKHDFVPAVMQLFPDRLISLGRFYPLFRVAVANALIQETCTSNAVYSLSTGMAEIVPVLDIPLTLTDMIVLTKTQAFLVYKIGLALGLSTQWQDYVTEFGGVLGSGFLWRQLARSLIGLVPLWGIVPKIGIAYAGTYVVGHVVLQWYLTGRHVSRAQMNELYHQAFARGKHLAGGLVEKLPKPQLKRRQRPPELVIETSRTPGKVCPQCDRLNFPDARLCQYCGTPFTLAPAQAVIDHPVHPSGEDE